MEHEAIVYGCHGYNYDATSAIMSVVAMDIRTMELRLLSVVAMDTRTMELGLLCGYYGY